MKPKFAPGTLVVVNDHLFTSAKLTGDEGKRVAPGDFGVVLESVQFVTSERTCTWRVAFGNGGIGFVWEGFLDEVEC